MILDFCPTEEYEKTLECLNNCVLKWRNNEDRHLAVPVIRGPMGMGKSRTAVEAVRNCNPPEVKNIVKLSILGKNDHIWS